MSFPTVSALTKPQVTLNVGGGSTATYDLLDFTGGALQFNVSPLKPYGSNRQGVRGDGTFRIPPIRLTIRVPGTRGTAMFALASEVRFVESIEVGGLTLEIAGGSGIVSWAPLGYSDTRVVIELIPATLLWEDEGTPTSMAVT